MISHDRSLSLEDAFALPCLTKNKSITAYHYSETREEGASCRAAHKEPDFASILCEKERIFIRKSTKFDAKALR